MAFQFEDGATATGFFKYELAAGNATLSSFDIKIAGGILSAVEYTPANTHRLTPTLHLQTPSV